MVVGDENVVTLLKLPMVTVSGDSFTVTLSKRLHPPEAVATLTLSPSSAIDATAQVAGRITEFMTGGGAVVGVAVVVVLAMSEVDGDGLGMVVVVRAGAVVVVFLTDW